MRANQRGCFMRRWKYWPVTEAMYRKLQLMLDTLDSHRLHVVLVPLNPNKRGWNEYGCKRVAADRNVTWYREFCSRFSSSRKRVHRKHDTLIRRQHILAALERLLSGKPKGTVYEERVLSVARGIKL